MKRNLIMLITALSAMLVAGVVYAQYQQQDFPTQAKQDQQQKPALETGKPLDFPLKYCPMVVYGAKAEYEKTKDGAALKFTTDSGNVENLRTRVDFLASLYNDPRMGFQEQGPMLMVVQMRETETKTDNQNKADFYKGDQFQGLESTEPAAKAAPQEDVEYMITFLENGNELEAHDREVLSEMLMNARATVENIDHGAKLVLRPAHRKDLKALRQHVQWISNNVGPGLCPRITSSEIVS